MKYLTLVIAAIVMAACNSPQSQSVEQGSKPPGTFIQVKFKNHSNHPTVGITDYILITDDLGNDSSEARLIIEAKAILPLAMQRHDSVLFDSTLAKEFIYHGEEAFFNREEYIHDRVHAKWMISDVQYENLVLEFFDKYAMLTYRNKVTEKDEVGKDQLYTWFWADVWIKEDGSWKLKDLRALN